MECRRPAFDLVSEPGLLAPVTAAEEDLAGVAIRARPSRGTLTKLWPREAKPGGSAASNFADSSCGCSARARSPSSVLVVLSGCAKMYDYHNNMQTGHTG